MVNLPKKKSGNRGMELAAGMVKVGSLVYLVYHSHIADNLQTCDDDDDWHVFRYSNGWYAHERLSTCVA